MRLSIRRAEPADAALVYELVCALADYEKLRHEVDATPEEIAKALFAPEPRLYCALAEWHGEAGGFAEAANRIEGMIRPSRNFTR